MDTSPYQRRPGHDKTSPRPFTAALLSVSFSTPAVADCHPFCKRIAHNSGFCHRTNANGNIAQAATAPSATAPSGRAVHQDERSIRMSGPSGRAVIQEEQSFRKSGHSGRAVHQEEWSIRKSGPSGRAVHQEQWTFSKRY